MRSTGLHLRHIHFVKSENIIYRIPTGWFTVNVSLTYLHLSDLNIFAIEKDAFNGNSFVNLRELSISDTAISSLNSGIFHGLFSLTILTLTNSKVHFFAPNTLRTLPVLRQFTMTRCVKQEISLDNLFGMAKLEHLQKVQVSKCCLNRSITNLTFSGLTNIIELNLMSNHIEEIGSKSFNSIFKTLKYLYLGKNNLKTARNLFFPKMATNVQIFLEENEWHCDCDMENVRRLILNAKFMKFNDVICQTPLAMNQIVLNTYKKTLCSKLTMLLKTKAPIILVVPTEATNTKESEGNETIAVAPESEESFEDLPMNTTCPVQCDVSNEEFVKHSMDYVTFTKLSVHIFPFRYKDGKLMLFTSEKSKDFVYVGFEQCTPYRKYKQISRCIGNSEGTERKVEITLKLNQSYRFCQMEKSDITIKPFECVSIYSQTKDQQEIEETEQSTCWIMREQKTIAIIGFIVLAICMPFVGILVAIILAKFFPKRIRGIQHNETIASIPKQVVRIDSTNQFRFVTVIFITFYVSRMSEREKIENWKFLLQFSGPRINQFVEEL